MIQLSEKTDRQTLELVRLTRVLVSLTVVLVVLTVVCSSPRSRNERQGIERRR